MKLFLSILVVSMTLLFSVFSAQAETLQDEAARENLGTVYPFPYSDIWGTVYPFPITSEI